ncbi:MAG: helix-turn-helix transcriptional regulator [Pseudobdellovibrionaceae bacterium]|nr:MAG: helix-turn-helix transcriptional regulator [Pseudobdellovibrionaceae bacterium]
MSTKKKKTPAYDKLSKKFGKVTFASHLEAVIETDFDSRAACAKKLGMSPQSLHDYITAKRIPSPSLAGKMAKKLGYPPAAFIELALSDSVKKAGYKYDVKLESA